MLPALHAPGNIIENDCLSPLNAQPGNFEDRLPLFQCHCSNKKTASAQKRNTFAGKPPSCDGDLCIRYNGRFTSHSIHAAKNSALIHQAGELLESHVPNRKIVINLRNHGCDCAELTASFLEQIHYE